jgi:hypothetical protein
LTKGLVQRFTWARLDSRQGIVRQHLLAQP